MSDQLELHFEPTPTETCWMCHLSSGCEGCCRTCKASCNAGQHCMIGVPGQADRLEWWIGIVKEIPELQTRRKYA